MPSKSPKNALRLLCVGRQFRWKNPRNIISALARFKDVRLLCIGDGPERPVNQKLAQTLCPGKVHFLPILENRRLVQKISKTDAVILNTRYHEWSKVMIEAMLLGRPVIVNRETASKVGELKGRPPVCEFCPDSPEGYARAIEKLRNVAYRKGLAQRARKKAWQLANPRRMEALQARVILNTARKQVENE